MKRLSLQLILLVCFIPCYTVFAQQAEWGEDNGAGIAKHACRFVYPQGSAEIRSGLGNNANVLSQLDSFIQSAVTNSGLHIYRIFLSAYSSIEGSYAVNERLAYNRVESFRDYLTIRYPELSRYPVDIVWVAEDWGELSRLVRMSNINEREEILEIIRKVPNFDEREELLVKLNGGRAYMELQETILPQLRRVEIKIEYTSLPSPSKTEEIVQPVVVSVPVQQPATTPVKSEKMSNEEINDWLGIGNTKRRTNTDNTPRNYTDNNVVSNVQVQQPTQQPTQAVVTPTKSTFGSEVLHPSPHAELRFTIKTNVLSWIGILPDFKYTTPVANVALEYFITPSWSVEAGAAYSYWRYNHNQEFQGISGYRIEPRYRYNFPCDWLEVYLGLYGRVGDYDIRRLTSNSETETDIPETSNHTGDYWDIGLSAGATFKIGRGWAVEVGARTGYLRTNSIVYTRDNQYNWFKSKEPYNKLKVTDLNLSVIYGF